MIKYFKRILMALCNRTYIEDNSYNTSICHLRDMIHNLPFYLNLDKKDEAFLFDVFAYLDKVVVSSSSGIDFNDFDYLRDKYIGKYAGHGLCDEIKKIDVDRAEKGHGNSLLKIAKAVLFNNREKYQKTVG